jgi:hypothetical protein
MTTYTSDDGSEILDNLCLDEVLPVVFKRRTAKDNQSLVNTPA